MYVCVRACMRACVYGAEGGEDEKDAKPREIILIHINMYIIKFIVHLISFMDLYEKCAYNHTYIKAFIEDARSALARAHTNTHRHTPTYILHEYLHIHFNDKHNKFRHFPQGIQRITIDTRDIFRNERRIIPS